jgi:DNA-binding transcriptional LysR family regulator
MQISLKQIQYFLAAAETGQFSAAATKVHVTQTAITAAIKELESALGLALFHRHHASGVSIEPRLRGFRFLGIGLRGGRVSKPAIRRIAPTALPAGRAAKTQRCFDALAPRPF